MIKHSCSKSAKLCVDVTRDTYVVQFSTNASRLVNMNTIGTENGFNSVMQQLKIEHA